MSNLISIIIPSYNAEKHIGKCLQSILQQSYRDIEVIVVDDGSTDQTISEIKKIEDKRIKLIVQKENKGQSAARNRALQEAKGKWIGFVDADDTIDKDFYETLLKKGISEKADIVMGETRYVSENQNKIIHNEERTAIKFQEKIKLLKHGGPCDKIYRKRLLQGNNIFFPEGLIWEDNLFVLQSIYWANKVISVKGVRYNYINNSSSTTQSPEKEDKRLKDGLSIAGLIMNFFEKKKIGNIDNKEIKKFILKNIINKKRLSEKMYYEEVSKILGEFFELKKLRLQKVLKNYFHLLAKRKKTEK